MNKPSIPPDPDSPTVSRADHPASRSEALVSFLDELSAHLQLDHSSGVALGANLPFHGPNGLICRIETENNGADLRARPQLLLPLTRDEIRQIEVGSLLSVQAVVMEQLGWMLGQSTEGLLQLAPMSWTVEAGLVARELDLGTSVGHMVLAMLRPDSDDDRGHSH